MCLVYQVGQPNHPPPKRTKGGAGLELHRLKSDHLRFMSISDMWDPGDLEFWGVELPYHSTRLNFWLNLSRWYLGVLVIDIFIGL